MAEINPLRACPGQMEFDVGRIWGSWEAIGYASKLIGGKASGGVNLYQIWISFGYATLMTLCVVFRTNSILS
jgi:hypothetical protein